MIAILHAHVGCSQQSDRACYTPRLHAHAAGLQAAGSAAHDGWVAGGHMDGWVAGSQQYRMLYKSNKTKKRVTYPACK